MNAHAEYVVVIHFESSPAWLVRKDGQWEAWGPGWPSWVEGSELPAMVRRFTAELAHATANTLARSFPRHRFTVVAVGALAEFFALQELGDIA